MKRSIFYLLIVLLTSSAMIIGEQQILKVPADSAIIIHVRNNTVQKIQNSANHSMVASESSANYMRTHSLFSWCKKHPWLTVVGCCGTLYAAVWGLFIKATIKMRNKQSWSVWNNEVPLELLQKVTRGQLVEELVNTMKMMYGKSYDRYDLFVAFLRDCDSELRFYQYMEKLVGWLELSKLMVLFPGMRLTRVALEARRNKLLFLKTTITATLHECSAKN